MNFIHFGLRMEIEKLYLEWCEEEGIANKPNSMVVFLMEKGWLNEEKIIKDLNEPKTEQTDIHGLTDCDFCKEKNCEDCEGGKTEPQTEYDAKYNLRRRSNGFG